ncbi:BT_3044 domain-containing protein [Parasediminibacterium sp. JCM 36343]|uniref:BT_3044 domain-containing protein n=1 Tax=Parasediminibacterium sp. JCM 36343 TaxID=3374279 RepID=UPI00397A8918
MKTISKIIFSIFLANILGGCLKNTSDYKDYQIQSDRTTGDKNIIELGLTTQNNSNFYSPAFPLINYDTTVQLVPVTLNNAGVATEDINVTVSVVDSVLYNYQKYVDTTLVTNLAPKSMYTIINPGGIVTIPKGSRTGYLSIKFTPIKYFLDTFLSIPFAITAIDKPAYQKSGNLSTGVVEILIKNKYDADYNAKGYLYHPSSPRAIKQVKHLGTIDATTVEMPLGDLGGSGYLAAVTVNPDNSLTIVAETGAAGAPYYMFTSGLPTTAPGYTPAWSGSSLCNNTYDPATQTFYVRYGYKGGTGYRVTEEIIKRKN